MTEEIKKNSNKNTVATVGMRFSIIGLITFISIILMRLGIPLLFIGLILGIVGLFYKPRKRARIAVCIPLILIMILIFIGCYIRKSIKTPLNEFTSWSETQMKEIEDENFDEEKFENILQNEINNLINNTTENQLKEMYETSTGSNTIEKGAYLLFSILKEGFENSLKTYNELPELETNNENLNNDENNIDINIENNNEENDNEEGNIIDIFNQAEKDDINQIIDMLE